MKNPHENGKKSIFFEIPYVNSVWCQKSVFVRINQYVWQSWYEVLPSTDKFLYVDWIQCCHRRSANFSSTLPRPSFITKVYSEWSCASMPVKMNAVNGDLLANNPRKDTKVIGEKIQDPARDSWETVPNNLETDHYFSQPYQWFLLSTLRDNRRWNSCNRAKTEEQAWYLASE